MPLRQVTVCVRTFRWRPDLSTQDTPTTGEPGCGIWGERGSLYTTTDGMVTYSFYKETMNTKTSPQHGDKRTFINVYHNMMTHPYQNTQSYLIANSIQCTRMCTAPDTNSTSHIACMHCTLHPPPLHTLL